MNFYNGGWKRIIGKIRRMMWKGKIPGLCLVIVREGKEEIIQCLGYADLATKKPVNPGTLFELASCSKSFTALGILKLVDEGVLGLNHGVSSFFPWFHVFYRGKKYDISIGQLLNHTSGIPWQTGLN